MYAELQHISWSMSMTGKGTDTIPLDTYDPAIPLLGIYPEETKTEKDTCTPMFTAALYNS